MEYFLHWQSGFYNGLASLLTVRKGDFLREDGKNNLIRDHKYNQGSPDTFAEFILTFLHKLNVEK